MKIRKKTSTGRTLVFRVEGMPYRCNKQINGKKCGARKMPPKGTQDYSEDCPKCKNNSLVLDRYRLKCRKTPGKDHPPRCDCNGPKTRKADKIQNVRGVSMVFGPHRLGQLGCMHGGQNNPDDDEAEQARCWAHLMQDDIPLPF